MPKIKTPILRPLRTTGATLYTFPSAAEDIALNINSGTQGVAMSHYALLNFTKENFNFTSPNEIVLSLQNWMMNSEVVLLNQPVYNFQENKTVTERVFWNWVRNHSNIDIFKSEPVYDNVYSEVNYKSADKNRLVQCFGMIDSGNHLSTEFGMFNETYVNVPTSYGNGPVFFESLKDDNNYVKGIGYSVDDIIQGRTQLTPTYISSSNSLKSENSEYKDQYAFEIVKDMQTISKACSVLTGNKKSVILNSYDDVNIDPSNQFSSISGLDINTDKCEFKFNAILLYYSLYDLTDSNKEAVATNLFGIVFLDGGSASDSTYLLQPVVKKKSFKSQNSKTSYFGNGYSFRVNIKTMSVYDNTDSIIQDNTTGTSLYAQDFNDVISNLNKAIDVMNTNMQTTTAIQNKYMEIYSEYVNIRREFSELETKMISKVEDLLKVARDEFNMNMSEAIIDLKYELGIEVDPTEYDQEVSVQTYGSSNVNQKPALLEPILKHLYPQLKQEIQDRSGVYGVAAPSETGIMSNAKIDILSASNANINAVNDVNITGSDINFNFKSGNDVSKVSMRKVIERINSIEKTCDSVRAAADVVTALGLIPVIDILPPRSKKPEIPGFYLKENTEGNIIQYVSFDGNEYGKPVKCESGKMYSVRGVIYVFNGETCVKLGS